MILKQILIYKNFKNFLREIDSNRIITISYKKIKLQKYLFF